MKISEIKNHIAKGGKFFVKDNGIFREVRFKSIVMRPRYQCSVCSWSIEGLYEVATEHGIENIIKGMGCQIETLEEEIEKRKNA